MLRCLSAGGVDAGVVVRLALAPRARCGYFRMAGATGARFGAAGSLVSTLAAGFGFGDLQYQRVVVGFAARPSAPLVRPAALERAVVRHRRTATAISWNSEA